MGFEVQHFQILQTDQVTCHSFNPRNGLTWDDPLPWERLRPEKNGEEESYGNNDFVYYLMVSIIFVGFQPPELYLNLNIISQLSQLFDSSVPSVLMVISHCCWGSSCTSERNRWFWPAKKAEICSEFRQCQQWRSFKSSVPAKKNPAGNHQWKPGLFSTPQWIFSFFSQNSIRIFHVLRSVPVQTSRLGSRTGGLTMGICWSYP